MNSFSKIRMMNLRLRYGMDIRLCRIFCCTNPDARRGEVRDVVFREAAGNGRYRDVDYLILKEFPIKG